MNGGNGGVAGLYGGGGGGAGNGAAMTGGPAGQGIIVITLPNPANNSAIMMAE